MQTLNIETARNKGAKIKQFIEGTAHIKEDGLAAYHAAQAVMRANLCTGLERRCAKAKEALKRYSIVVSIAPNNRGLHTVRLFSPSKQIEMFL